MKKSGKAISYLAKDDEKRYDLTKCGIVNNGKVIIPFEYTDISKGSPDGNYFIVRKDEKWGLINRQNKLIIPYEYDELDYPKDNLIAAYKNEKYGMIDLDNNIVLPFEYECVVNYLPDTIVAKQKGKWGFLNLNSPKECEFKYEDVLYPTQNPKYYYACINKRWGIVDKNESIIINFLHKDPIVLENKIIKVFNPGIKTNTIHLTQKQTGLPMRVELVTTDYTNQRVYLLVQNDDKTRKTSNYVKVFLDGTIMNEKQFVFEDHYKQDLKTWIAINKYLILMYWTKEITEYSDVKKLLRTLNVISPHFYLGKENWSGTKIISAGDLEEYFKPVKEKIIGRTIDKIFYTGLLYNRNWDDCLDYKDGEWYSGDNKVEPGYYQWKENDTMLVLDSPIILQFGDYKLEIEYWSGSLVTINNNTIDTKKYGADVSRHFSRNIIGHKLVDIQIHKTDLVYFMNFGHLGIERKDGDDMFEEIWFVFDNGYRLELTTDHIDYTIFREIRN